MSYKILVTFIIGAFFVGCSSTPEMKTSSDFNPDIDTSTYKTFSWISEQPFIRGSTFVADSSREKIQNNIYSGLVAKGYVFVADPMKADFVISYTVGSRSDIKASSYPTYYRSGWTWGQAYWGGGYFVTGSYSVGVETYSSGTRYSGTNIKVKTYTEGQLAIDVFDVKMAQPAWHGVALTEITTKIRKDPGATIQTAVTQILSSFPSKS